MRIYLIPDRAASFSHGVRIDMSKKQPKVKSFKGTVICPTCKLPYDINTTDESLLKDPPNCFRCFMTYGAKKKND